MLSMWSSLLCNITTKKYQLEKCNTYNTRSRQTHCVSFLLIFTIEIILNLINSKMPKNPETGRKIKRDGPTWCRLIKGGYHAVEDRILRREHADVENAAIRLLGHPLNLPIRISDERLADLMAELNSIDMRNQPVAVSTEPKPDPLDDSDVDDILDDLNDIEIQDGAIRWTSRTPPDYSVERIPTLVDGARYYTLEVNDVLFTFPGVVPTAAAIPADEVDEDVIQNIIDLFAEEKNQRFALIPVEIEPRITDDEITFRSFDRIHLEANNALSPAVVAALDPDTMYTLYGIFGYHDDDGAPIEFVDENVKPQPFVDAKWSTISDVCRS